ncbi:MAG TPA: hypothetical protein PK159_14765, partial [Steroidobacteraceae bacterium]|nr:hypothetical protein [Steroidobacteraceae bacterium]
TAIAFGVLTYLSIKVLLETIALADTSTVLRIAVWPIQLCLPLAFGLGTLRHGLYSLVPELRPAERSEADLDIRVSADTTMPAASAGRDR